MLGGIDNHSFLQGLGGFFALLIIIPLAIWTSGNSPSKAAKKRKKILKAELRRIKRK